MAQKSCLRFDVLNWKPVRAALLSPAFPPVLQGAALAAVTWLIWNGFHIGAGMDAGALMTLRKTNLTTLAVWGLWWPGMIAVALALGRAWCTVCPMELVNRIGETVGKSIGWPRARLGRFLRAEWLIVLLYLVLQLLVAGISMHRVPHYTAIFLCGLVGLALFAGLVFRESRSFCRAFCPAGALLSAYGRYTPLQLSVKDPSVCDACSTRDCVRPENRGRFDKRSCPSMLVPFRRQASDGCVLCLQCAKICPHQNMGFGMVTPETSIRHKALLQPFEAVFVMIALGFVAHEVIGEVKWLDAVFHIIPQLCNELAPSIAFGWFEALWFLVIFPAAVWTGIAVLGYGMGHRGDLQTLMLAAATGAAPVVAVAHLAKAAAKVGAWGGFLPLAVQDSKGIDTLHMLAGQTLHTPVGLVQLSLLGWIMLALILVVGWRAWMWVREVPAPSISAAQAGLLGAVMLFSTVLTIWGWPGLS